MAAEFDKARSCVGCEDGIKAFIEFAVGDGLVLWRDEQAQFFGGIGHELPQAERADKRADPWVVHGFDEGEGGELWGESSFAEGGLDMGAITAFDAQSVLKEMAVAALPRELGAGEIAKHLVPAGSLVARLFTDLAIKLSGRGGQPFEGVMPACAVDGFGLIAHEVPTDGAQAFFVEFLEAGALSVA